MTAVTTTLATWMIEMRFEEDPSRTHALAVLRTPSGRELHGHG